MPISDDIREYIDIILSKEINEFATIPFLALHCDVKEEELYQLQYLPFLEQILSIQKAFLTKNGLSRRIDPGFAKFLYETQLKQLEERIIVLKKYTETTDAGQSETLALDTLHPFTEAIDNFLTEACNALFSDISVDNRYNKTKRKQLGKR